MKDYLIKSVRTAAILTNSYVAGTVIDAKMHTDQLVLLVKFTKGSLDSMSLKIEFSDDGTNYYQQVSSAVSSGTSTITQLVHTISATGNYAIPANVKVRFIKVSVIGTGTVTSSSCTVDAIIGTI